MHLRLTGLIAAIRLHCRRCAGLALLAATLVALPIASTASGTVLSGPLTNPANGHSYYVLDIIPTWTAAEAEAVTLGGHLATINDAAENQWVFDNLSAPASRYLWIGLNDVASEGTYVWISGEPVTYTNWGSGEPNNGFGTGEDYSFMLGSPFGLIQAGEWNDITNDSPGVYGAVEVVPEPGSLILAGWGLLAILLHGRRRRTSHRRANH